MGVAGHGGPNAAPITFRYHTMRSSNEAWNLLKTIGTYERKQMKTRVGMLLVLLAIMFMPYVAFSWTATNIITEKGTKVSISQKAALHYQTYWKRQFNNIQWDDIDTFFVMLAEAYGVPEADPKQIRIVIADFDEAWVDNETPVNADSTTGREMVGNHWDGMYNYTTITIHLGDDQGVGENSFCQTALGHELGHHFMRLNGTPT